MSDSRKFTKSSELKRVDESKLCDKLSQSASSTVSFLEAKLQKDGSYGADAKDIACYFKSPMMFLAANKPFSASLILGHIKCSFMSKDGDFKTTNGLKSANAAYIEYWSYINGWIVRAAHQLGMTDISQLGHKYLIQYNRGGKKGFLTHNIKDDPYTTDVLTTAHLGLINLESGNLEAAISAGNYLCETFKKQSAKDGFYLRRDNDGNLVQHFLEDMKPFYFISMTEPNQLHFMVGYPAAYLAMLYKKTNNLEYLKASQEYLDFSLSCEKSVYTCDFSHKIAWAASILYECTGNTKYLAVIEKIADHFIKNQKNGMWFSDDILASYDQSAEIACWFLEIVKNVSCLKIKEALTDVSPVTHKMSTMNK